MLSVELALYVFVYEKFHLVTLPWDSPGTWYLCFIGVDFLYYWFHRAAHGKISCDVHEEFSLLFKNFFIMFLSSLFYKGLVVYYMRVHRLLINYLQ